MLCLYKLPLGLHTPHPSILSLSLLSLRLSLSRTNTPSIPPCVFILSSPRHRAFTLPCIWYVQAWRLPFIFLQEVICRAVVFMHCAGLRVSGSRPGCPLISPRSPFFSSRPSIKVLHGLKQSTCGWRCPRTLHSVHCLTLETPRQKLLSAGPQQMSVGHNVIPPLYIGLTTGYLSFKKTFFLLLEEMLTGSECGFSLVGELYSKPVR